MIAELQVCSQFQECPTFWCSGENSLNKDTFCDINNDCMDGLACVGDVCTPVCREEGLGWQCDSDQQCPYDLLCYDSQCVNEENDVAESLGYRDMKAAAKKKKTSEHDVEGKVEEIDMLA